MGEMVGEGLQWTEYRGKRFLFSDYSNLTPEQFVERMKRIEPHLVEIGSRQGEGSLLLLTTIAGSHIAKGMLDQAKEMSRRVKPYTKAHAVYPVNRIRQTMLSLIAHFTGMNNRGFETEEDAKEWLASQAAK